MELNDESRIPCGKYKGTALSAVPADYLLARKEKLSTKKDRNSKRLYSYILRNLDVLVKEVEVVKEDEQEHCHQIDFDYNDL